ncbi:GMC oxidoreductase [Piloderma croceum F 1598]|uniref:GMC oxidoreductase n=1 Tax=Piloderma croceum (strain F 1598) TaxID=765440 RepID=A0A0C3GDW4_PILCF|nr:GMC oxidoreductase [Piloderma croceum F 1598]
MVAKIADVADKSFDYIIIGGGTAGLTAAARLSEDPSISVAVLEAGSPNLDDPKIIIPAQLTKTFTDPQYDWAFTTNPQKNANNRVSLWNRGKGLGGSSAMNFYGWIKPPAADMDAFEKLGNPNWTWKNFEGYSKLTETSHVAAKEHAAVYPHTFNAAYRGTAGPIQVSIPHHLHTLDLLFRQSFENKGLKSVPDPYGGEITGTCLASASMDPKTWTRSYAATGYYQPNKDRSNLTVLTEAFVSRILFGNDEAGKDLTATGVEFFHGGKAYVVHVQKEIILSAGTIKSPHVLELSGIGRPDVLSKIGVDLKINLPGVGENVQEHHMVGITVELDTKGGHETMDFLRDPEYAAKALELHAEGKGLYRMGVTSFAYIPLSTTSPKEAPGLIEGVAQKINDAKRDGKLPPGLAEQLDVQLEILRNDTLPDVEIVAVPCHLVAPSPPEPGKSYVTLFCIIQHPFSRGYIHARSKDPTEQPEIEPNYFDWDFDLEALVQTVKYAKSLSEVEPWKSGNNRELDPGPECKTDEEIRECIRKIPGRLSTTYHTWNFCLSGVK